MAKKKKQRAVGKKIEPKPHLIDLSEFKPMPGMKRYSAEDLAKGAMYWRSIRIAIDPPTGGPEDGPDPTSRP